MAGNSESLVTVIFDVRFALLQISECIGRHGARIGISTGVILGKPGECLSAVKCGPFYSIVRG